MERPNSTNDAVELALYGRTAVYRTLWATFGGEPGPSLVETLAGNELAYLAGVLGDDACLCAAASLQARAAALLDQAPEAVEALQNAYNRLFVGPGAPEAAPWESVYASNDGTLFGPITLEVRKFFVANGFIPQGYPNVADDHVGLELDFMRLLGDRALAAHRSGDAAARHEALAASAAFLKEHLALWAPGFACKLRAARHGALYQEAAAFLEAFVACDAQLLGELAQAAPGA